ncbi:MAG: hypothetical protein R3321_14175, partial [Nitrososphaeraceae archaeon]|nr:hypothetical protein [Nitrososphaeraceae archaeon]
MTPIKLISIISFLLTCSFGTQAQKLDSLFLYDIEKETEISVSRVLNNHNSVVVFFDLQCPYVDFYAKRLKEISLIAQERGYKMVFINPHQKIK